MELTPAEAQYVKLKEEYKDSVLLFRMGDFYEVFDDDAKLLSKILGLTLTSRSKGTKARPMAGVPYHALNTCLLYTSPSPRDRTRYRMPSSA